ncbi:MAG: TlpA family protein disulfide reductase [Prolixibacteraceae bacterium]|nr:TlpA family protein disulfide reductase [Prolixibacteraceae bacterium]
MKRIILIAGAVIMLFSCGKTERKESVITGTLSNELLKDDIREKFGEKYQIAFEGNRFLIRIPVEYSQEYFYLTDRVEVFLLPGDSVFIESADGGFQFLGGRSAVISNILKEINQKKQKVMWDLNAQELYSLAPDSFKTVIIALQNDLIKLVDDTDAAELNYNFTRLEKEKINYRIYRILNTYEINFNGKNELVKKPDSTFYTYLAHADFRDTTLLQLNDFQKFIKSTIDLKLRQVNIGEKAQKHKFVRLMFSEIDKLNPSVKIRDEMIYYLMQGQIYNLNVNDAIMDTLQNLCKNGIYLSELQEMYLKYQKVLPGKPAPDFRFIDSIGKVYTLVDFEGSYLYMDVWGLFCAPCLKAVPAFNKIKYEFKDKNIAFIGVCRELPENRERWIDRMGKFNVTGLQFLPEDESKFINDYLIGEIPRYILIDKEGRFLNANAPDPSEELKTELYKYLN